MRQYFTDLRSYRVSDQNYQTLRVKWNAESLGELDRQLKAFEMGLKVAGGGILGLENVGVDYPQGSSSKEYVEVGDPNFLLELQYFMGTRRDRRHRPVAPIKTEKELEGNDGKQALAGDTDRTAGGAGNGGPDSKEG